MVACGSLNMIKLFTPQKLHLAELRCADRVFSAFFVNFSCGNFAFFAKCGAFLGPKNRAFARCLGYAFQTFLIIINFNINYQVMSRPISNILFTTLKP